MGIVSIMDLSFLYECYLSLNEHINIIFLINKYQWFALGNSILKSIKLTQLTSYPIRLNNISRSYYFDSANLKEVTAYLFFNH